MNSQIVSQQRLHGQKSILGDSHLIPLGAVVGAIALIGQLPLACAEATRCAVHVDSAAIAANVTEAIKSSLPKVYDDIVGNLTDTIHSFVSGGGLATLAKNLIHDVFVQHMPDIVKAGVALTVVGVITFILACVFATGVFVHARRRH